MITKMKFNIHYTASKTYTNSSSFPKSLNSGKYSKYSIENMQSSGETTI